MYDVWGVYSFMSRNELQSHVEDILSFLSEETKEKVGVEKIQRELEKFMEYGVPIDQAKQTIIKKFTGNTSFNAPVSSERRLIADLQPNEKSVNLLGHIIAINPKEVSVRGGKKQIYYGIIGDESETGPLSDTENDAVAFDNAPAARNFLPGPKLPQPFQSDNPDQVFFAGGLLGEAGSL